MTNATRPAPPCALLADDQASYRTWMAEILEEAGLRVDTAIDGRDAILRLESDTHYHVLVTDLQMPHYTGFEVAEAWIRAGRSPRRVVMVSGAAGSATVRFRAGELGITLLSKAQIDTHLEQEVRHALASDDRGG